MERRHGSARARWTGARRASFAIVTTALLGPGAALAQDSASQAGPRENDTGMDVAAGLASVVYAPAKVAYAIGGSVVAGLAYAASAGDRDVAEPILDASLRGDYLVTPSHLTGERKLEFVGRRPEDRALHGPTAAASSGDGLDGTAP